MPSMLLNELSTLKFHKKEKVKDSNKRFSTILNNFLPNVALDDSITVDFYTMALPCDIIVFFMNKDNIFVVYVVYNIS